MKRIFTSLICAIFIFSLYSCRETEMNTDGNTEEPDKVQKTEQQD